MTPRTLLVALFALAASCVASRSASAQPSPGPARLAVFLDCHTGCDFDLIRQEMSYIDWVRERTAVDVHLLVTSQGTGAGGSEYTLAFLGLRAMTGRSDTLRFILAPTTTGDERRRQLVRVIAAGLAPFVVRSGNASLLRITAAPASGGDRPRAVPTRDPWRAWVFELGLNGGVNGQARYKSQRLQSSMEARRVTEAWKYNFEFDFEYQDDRVTDIDYDKEGNVVSEETFTNLRRNWGAEQLLVKSLTGHASVGLLANLQSNTFRNIRRGLEMGPAIEYNIFPYSEATRRELIVRYAAGYAVNRYVDVTIFDRLNESLPLQVLMLNYRTRAPWGSLNFRTEHRNYLSDAAKRNTNVNGSFNVRVFQGLQVNMNGGYSWIRDQIALRKGGGSQVDVLLRRRELLTGYRYNAGVGVSYTFGSIFNNVVNPRF